MKALKYIKYYGGGVLVLVIVFFIVRYAVMNYRRPGSMTVLEAQAMDMSSTASQGSIPVAVETAEAQDFAPTVTYTGSVVAYSDAEVYPRVTGTLVALMVYPGQQVRAGQVVARLDSAELSSKVNEAAAAKQASWQELDSAQSELQQAVAQQRMAEAKITGLHSAERDTLAQIDATQAMQEQARREREAAEANLADAEANTRAMQADVDYWKNEIAREERLLQAKAISREEYERERSQAQGAQAKLTQAQAGIREKQSMVAIADSKIRQAEANLVSAQAKREQARSDIQSAEAELASAGAAIKVGSSRIRNRKSMAQQSTAQERTAGIVRDYTEIRTLQDGIVTERLVSPGTLVQPGMALLRIKSMERVRLQANVAEADLAGIQVGSAIFVTTPRDPKFHLKTAITSIFNAANPQSRTVLVEALIANPGGRLLPGQYVVLQIATSAPRQALTVPLEAIRRDLAQNPFVWTATADGQGGETYYTCLMHPQVHLDHPGNCPICGMKLVPKMTGGKQTAHRVSVTLGTSDGKRVVVTSGVSAGVSVIYQGHAYLQEGDTVTPSAWGREGPMTLPPSSGKTPAMPGMDMPGQTQSAPPAAKAPGPSMPNMPGMDHSKPPMPSTAPGGAGNGSMENMPGMGGR